MQECIRSRAAINRFAGIEEVRSGMRAGKRASVKCANEQVISILNELISTSTDQEYVALFL